MKWEMLPACFGRALRFICLHKNPGSFRGNPRVPSGGAVSRKISKKFKKSHQVLVAKSKSVMECGVGE